METTIVFPIWDDKKSAKVYRNIVCEETRDPILSTNELMRKVCEFFNDARQGWTFELDGNEIDGYIIRAYLKPTTNRAKEMSKSDVQ